MYTYIYMIICDSKDAKCRIVVSSYLHEMGLAKNIPPATSHDSRVTMFVQKLDQALENMSRTTPETYFFSR